MRSPDDRTNLLSPQADRIGVAIITSRGVLYAIAGLLRHSGIVVQRDPTAARATCVTDTTLSRSEVGRHPGFVLRWQDSDLTKLPEALVDRIKTPQYGEAAVGSCPAQDVNGAFTTYRVAVLLY